MAICQVCSTSFCNEFHHTSGEDLCDNTRGCRGGSVIPSGYNASVARIVGASTTDAHNGKVLKITSVVVDTWHELGIDQYVWYEGNSTAESKP